MSDLRNELLTYSKDQLIELQNLLLKKIERIKAEMHMMASSDFFVYLEVTYRYTKAIDELAITREILKPKEKK